MKLRLKKLSLEINLEVVVYGIQQLAFGWLLLFYLPDRRRDGSGRYKKSSKQHHWALPLAKQTAISSGIISLGIAGAVFFGWLMMQPDVASPTVSGQPYQPQTILEVTKTYPESAPTRLRIPSIGVDTSFIELGRAADGSLAVPEAYDVVGWYKFAPTPGELGPAIVVGHVDSYRGAAVFWKLPQLKPGDVVEIDRADGTTVKFQVNELKQFAQSSFPTQEVYGNLNYAGLRLITCSGSFSSDTQSYDHNTVVYASLIN